MHAHTDSMGARKIVLTCKKGLGYWVVLVAALAACGKDHALEVIAIVAASTISNYTGSITKPPLEAPFQAHIWKEPDTPVGAERRRVG